MENAIVESWIQGVSTRRVRSIVECPGIEGISADTVSRMTHDLDQGVRDFLEHPLEMPVVYLNGDASYLNVRNHGRYVSKPVLLIAGIRTDGYREIPGKN